VEYSLTERALFPFPLEPTDPALDRMAQDFAARLVAAVIENY
jgi:hypothetical protein